MRKLIYVPVLHMSADLGSVAADVAWRSAARVGDEAWARHMEAISSYWRALEGWFAALDARGLLIYQDGMMAEGSLGRKIIEDGRLRGSSNFEIVADLLDRGAILVRTEDIGLLKKEHELIIRISKARGIFKKITAYLQFKFLKKKLLKNRDRFIAQRIGVTLKEGQTGVLFIGAFHDVRPWLSNDIKVFELSDRDKLCEYQESFIHYKRHPERVEELSKYLASPVEAVDFLSS